MTRGVTVLGAVSALIAGSTATAVAQGPGAGNSGPNVLNYGSCIFSQVLSAGLEPQVYMTQSSPGVYFQDLETGEVREVRFGDSCSVGFSAPPP